jgi:hypothetical protein
VKAVGAGRHDGSVVPWSDAFEDVVRAAWSAETTFATSEYLSRAPGWASRGQCPVDRRMPHDRTAPTACAKHTNKKGEHTSAISSSACTGRGGCRPSPLITASQEHPSRAGIRAPTGVTDTRRRNLSSPRRRPRFLITPAGGQRRRRVLAPGVVHRSSSIAVRLSTMRSEM